MAFIKKTALPLSHSAQLQKHMQIFSDTLNGLRDLEVNVAEELTEVEDKAASLKNDLANVQDAIARVRKVTG